MARQLDYNSIHAIFTRFQALEPEPKGELHHTNAFTLLVAVALVWGAAVSLAVWFVVSEEVDELLDETLQSSAEVLGRLLVIGGRDALAEGLVITRTQDRALAVQQTIVRNIFMGREITTAFGFLDIAKERSEAERLMREIGFTSKVFSPDSIVGQLSGGERQGVAIARAIYNKADLIILDEPTTALSLTETEKVFRFVRTVRESGRSILFIGHNIHHVFDIAERFIVLDRGRVALEITKSEVKSAENLIAFMEHVAHPTGVGPLDAILAERASRSGAQA